MGGQVGIDGGEGGLLEGAVFVEVEGVGGGAHPHGGRAATCETGIGVSVAEVVQRRCWRWPWVEGLLWSPTPY